MEGKIEGGLKAPTVFGEQEEIILTPYLQCFLDNSL